jgi:hypothetical protein
MAMFWAGGLALVSDQGADVVYVHQQFWPSVLILPNDADPVLCNIMNISSARSCSLAIECLQC